MSIQYLSDQLLRRAAYGPLRKEETNMPRLDDPMIRTVFASEALRLKATQTRHAHNAKRRTFLSAKRNGWKGERREA